MGSNNLAQEMFRFMDTPNICLGSMYCITWANCEGLSFTGRTIGFNGKSLLYYLVHYNFIFG